MPWRFLKFVSQPEEHTALRHLKLRDQRKLLGLLSQHVTRHGCPSRLVPPVPQEQRVLQLGIVADPSTLCIALAACVGELFDLSSGLRLQPRTVSMN
jgi:hypothetical protein